MPTSRYITRCPVVLARLAGSCITSGTSLKRGWLACVDKVSSEPWSRKLDAGDRCKFSPHFCEVQNG